MVEPKNSFQKKHGRHSIRMKGYDYSLESAYFITIATYHKVCLFGKVINGDVALNKFGKIAYDQWLNLRNRFKGSDFSSFVIMPNHIHGIICLGKDEFVRGAGEESQALLDQIPPLRPYTISNVATGSLGAIVRAFKASATYRINALRDWTGPPVWQRNYYEHIIRNYREYEDIWDYIETNPKNWKNDEMNVA